MSFEEPQRFIEIARISCEQIRRIGGAGIGNIIDSRPDDVGDLAVALDQGGEMVRRLVDMKPDNQNMSSEVYAICRGRFIEAMLARFDKRVAYSYATAMPDANDLL